MVKLDYEMLMELQEYISQLDKQVGLSTETYKEVNQAIDKEIDKVRKESIWFVESEKTGSSNCKCKRIQQGHHIDQPSYCLDCGADV